jgi:hypothetical protein
MRVDEREIVVYCVTRLGHTVCFQGGEEEGLFKCTVLRLKRGEEGGFIKSQSIQGHMHSKWCARQMMARSHTKGRVRHTIFETSSGACRPKYHSKLRNNRQGLPPLCVELTSDTRESSSPGTK